MRGLPRRAQAALLALAVAAGAVASECSLARCAMSAGLVSGRCCCGEASSEAVVRPVCCEGLGLEAAPGLPDRPGAGAAPAAFPVASPLPPGPPFAGVVAARLAPSRARGTAPPLVILHRALLI